MNRTREATGVGQVVQILGELTMSHLYLLGVASLTLTSAGFAGSDMNADLQTRLEAAEARIAELSADQNQNWLNDERSDAVRSLVQDVLADADTRASLQGATGGAGYDGGFTIASGDGNWSMTINGGVWTSWTSVDDDTNRRRCRRHRWWLRRTRSLDALVRYYCWRLELGLAI